MLSRLGHQLTRVVDLGWSWMRPISEVLLKLLDWIFVVVRNYGLAIFVLALLVRVLLHPLNASSLKSMRAMQKLQPEVERLREKYKKRRAGHEHRAHGAVQGEQGEPGGRLPADAAADAASSWRSTRCC